MPSLSSTEIDQYRDDGFVVPDFRLSPGVLGTLREALDRVISRNPDTRPEQLISVHLSGNGPEGVIGDSAFLDLACDFDLVELVAQLIGEDVIMWGCQSFCKPGGDGMEVPWHQDGHYWPIRPLATCTIWVAIDDSTVENGCLRVIPRSHCGRELFPHLKEDRRDVVLNRKVEGGAFDVATAVDVELEAGQMSMHDVYLIHGSNANRSPKRRAGLAIRYMPGTSHFDRAIPPKDAGYQTDFAHRPIWLLQGEDRTGKNDFEVGH